ncbi:MAG: 4Fe-4S binding protein [Myxococcales bacterium]|nr:4Fe-4S binding protein [Myxococcales bacterium]
MGHGHGIEPRLLALQRRLDRMPIRAPAHPALFEILDELFRGEERRLAAAMPLRPSTTERIARCAGISARRAEELLRDMLHRGLVVDLPHPDGRTFWFLNPTVIGFFEFSMMRRRDDVDQARLARHVWEYFHGDPDLAFVRMIGNEGTFLARPLLQEEAVAGGTDSEILDEERATEIVARAGRWAEGICHCRHVQEHLGRRCAYPIDHCLALGQGADYLSRAGLARPIDQSRALDVLAHAKELGMVQMVDNVRRKPTFLCNCCSCCCEMLEGLRLLGGHRGTVRSNHAAAVDPPKCNGCGRCVRACPLGAIELVPEAAGAARKSKAHARVTADRCLGCGVCRRRCPTGAIQLHRTPTRIQTPGTQVERMVLQALERGTLAHLLFDDPTRLSHRVFARVLTTLLELPPARRLLARRQVRSRFVELLLGGWRPVAGHPALRP